ncbi:MAG: AbrB/MazE/SpoVT family DNA-binding domain-containing protein [Chloroflexota bacterium]
MAPDVPRLYGRDDLDTVLSAHALHAVLLFCKSAHSVERKSMTERDTATRLIRPLRGGQITIPADFRERLGIDSASVLQMSLIQGELRIRPVQVTERAGGSKWLKDLYDELAPVRRETGQSSEAAIDKAIDDAIAAVRGADA